MKQTARIIPLAVVAALLSGCMGSFVLTKKLYSWNETVTDSKFINNVLFWVLNVVPVYSLAVTADAVVLNLIEFWTGNNVLADAGAASDTRVVVEQHDDGSLTVVRGAETFLLKPRGDAVEIWRDGEPVGSAERTATGGVVAYDAAGLELAVITPAELAAGEEIIASATADR